MHNKRHDLMMKSTMQVSMNGDASSAVTLSSEPPCYVSIGMSSAVEGSRIGMRSMAIHTRWRTGPGTPPSRCLMQRAPALRCTRCQGFGSYLGVRFNRRMKGRVA